ncbi:hypothetical protein BDR04DRAFT_1117517 [Suillus decipiens]|nr:hypothetical protein BDR04DRAFT_1117517 [Suillus decipiens]
MSLQLQLEDCLENSMMAPVAYSATHIPAAVVVMPALNLTHTVVNSLSKLNMDQCALSGSFITPIPTSRSPPAQTTDIPVTIAIVLQDIGGESIYAEVLSNNNSKGQKKGQKQGKTSDVPPYHSSHKAQLISYDNVKNFNVDLSLYHTIGLTN